MAKCLVETSLCRFIPNKDLEGLTGRQRNSLLREFPDIAARQFEKRFLSFPHLTNVEPPMGASLKGAGLLQSPSQPCHESLRFGYIASIPLSLTLTQIAPIAGRQVKDIFYRYHSLDSYKFIPCLKLTYALHNAGLNGKRGVLHTSTASSGYHSLPPLYPFCPSSPFHPFAQVRGSASAGEGP